MEGLRNPASVPSEPCRSSVTSRPLLTDVADSVLTAARLARRGWTEDGKKTTWQFSHVHNSQPSVSRSDGNQAQIHVEVSLKDPRCRQAPVSNSRTTAEDKVTCSERRAEEEKQTNRGVFLLNIQNNRNVLREKQKILSGQGGVVYVWASGCRTKSRLSRRSKPPMLPVIAEI